MKDTELNLGTCFDRVVVINLRRQPGRLWDLERHLEQRGWPFRWPETFDAIDGRKLPTPEAWPAGPAWGRLLSHRQVLERAILDDVQRLLVLEDNVRLPPSFARDAEQFLRNVPDDWECLLLGGENGDGQQLENQRIVRCTSPAALPAYAVQGRALRELYAEWSAPRPAVHGTGLIAEHCADLNSYAPQPFIVLKDPASGSPAGQPPSCGSPARPIVLLNAPKEAVQELRKRGFHTGYWRDGLSDFDNGLIRIFSSGGGEAEKIAKLRQWVSEVAVEAAAIPNGVVAVWHPQATMDLLRQASNGNVVMIRADKPQAALEQWEAISTGKAIATSHRPCPVEAAAARAPRKYLILVHVYYLELWPDISERLQRFGRAAPFDLWVNVVADCPGFCNFDSWKRVLNGQFPDARLVVSPNDGTDIGGTLRLLQGSNLSQYDLICKLHTKVSPHNVRVGERWRTELYDALLGNPQSVARTFAEKCVTMATAGKWISIQKSGNGPRWAKLCKAFKLDHARAVGSPFPSGTMFWCRRRIMERFRDCGISPEEFNDRPTLDGGWSHAMERIFGSLAYENEGRLVPMATENPAKQATETQDAEQ